MLIGLGVSTCLLSIALTLLANLDLLILMGFITLLTPPGFVFVLLGILLLGTMIGTCLWTVFNSLVDAINARRARRETSHTTPLTEENRQMIWLNDRPVSLEEHTQSQKIVFTNQDDSQLDTDLSPEEELTAFFNERIIAENNKLLEKNAQSMADLDELINRIDKSQKVILDVVKELVREGKSTVPPNVNLDALSFISVDEEKSKNKTTSPTFFN